MGKIGFPTWAKNLEKATNGKVKMVTYPAGVMGGAREAYQQVVTDVVDISWQFVGVYESTMPLVGVMMLPMVQPSVPGNAKIASRMLWDLYLKYPEMQKHFADVKVLFLHAGGPSILMTAKKKIMVKDDFKGLKIRSAGGTGAEWLTKMGASPSAITMPELYGALQTGVVQGALAAWDAATGFKLEEVQKYYVDEGISGTAFFMIMNKQKWESLPPDIQKAIDSVSGYAGAEYIGQVNDDSEAASRKVISAKAGNEVYKIAPEELAKWKAVADEINKKWISDMKAKGLPGQAVYDDTVSLLNKYTSK